MDYLDNKYVIISLILVLLLFINYNTNDTTKEMTGGAISSRSMIGDSLLAICDKYTINSIAEFNIKKDDKYNIFSFFDLTINNSTEIFISIYRYDFKDNLIKKYPIFIPTKKERRYKKTHVFYELKLNADDKLKFVVPSNSSIIFSQEPVIIISPSNDRDDYGKLWNSNLLKKYNFTNNKINVLQRFNNDGSLAPLEYEVKF